MPTAKLAAYAQLAEETAGRITHSHQEWTGFLQTAARLYKYPYHEQLMIYAQRPEATACAEYEIWNKAMRRYVRRGSRGIALIDTASDMPKLRYVFDIADTGGRENSRRPFLWELTEQNTPAAMNALENGYDVPASEGLERQLHAIASELSQVYWIDHQGEILDIVDGSYLEGYDEFNVGASFRKAVSVSLEYALLSRCGLSPNERFIHEDFLPIFDWNTPEATATLGTAVSEMSELSYKRNGDYLIPYLTTEQTERPIGKYGRMRRTFLKEHRPILFNSLVVTGKLFPHLLEIEDAANSRLEQMMPDMAKAAGVTEALKAADPMKWVGLMNNLKAQAEEIILTELIHA